MGLDESRTAELFTRDDMESIFEKRKSHDRELLEQMVDYLNPQLERMADQISAANHVKEQLRVELVELTTAVKLSQERLEQHARLPAHPVGAKMLSDLGLETLSDEERGIFPDVMRAAVSDKARATTVAQGERRRVDMQLVIATAVGSLASLLLFGIGVVAFVFTHGASIQQP